MLTKCGLQADRFVLDELFRFEQRIRAAYESFDFPKGEINNDIQPRRTLSLTIYSHSPVLMESTNVLNLFSTFYFEMIRDTLYSEAKGAPSRAIIKAVLQSVRACLLRSPFELLEFDALTASSSPPLFPTPSQILNIVSQSLGPIVPYFAEELHAHRTDLQNPSVSAFARGWTSPVRRKTIWFST